LEKNQESREQKLNEQQQTTESNRERGWGGPRPNSGRPPGPGRFPLSSKKMRELAQSYSEEAIEELVAVMHNAESERDRLMAIALLLAYGYGKPREHVTVEQQETVR